jgi:hypothetical protein
VSAAHPAILLGIWIGFPADSVGGKITGPGKRSDLTGKRNAVKECGQAVVELRTRYISPGCPGRVYLIGGDGADEQGGPSAADHRGRENHVWVVDCLPYDRVRAAERKLRRPPPGQVLTGERDHSHDRLVVRAGGRHPIHHSCDRLVIAYHGAKELPAQHLLGLHRDAPHLPSPDLSRCGQQQRGGGGVV